jgi:hypothetical protein
MAEDFIFEFHFLAGDANQDALVDLSDLLTLSANWRGQNKTFSQGDFNYDDSVNEADLGILAINWRRTPDGDAGSGAGPMPAIAGLPQAPPPPGRRELQPFRPAARSTSLYLASPLHLSESIIP